jgi:hypothetical protein
LLPFVRKAEITIDHLAYTKASVNPTEDDVCRYGRGYLERDLAPDSLWSRSQSDNYDVFKTAVSSSDTFRVDGAAAPAYTPTPYGPAGELLDFDIQTYADILLATPGSLFSNEPQVRVFSKFRSIEHLPLVTKLENTSPLPAKRASATEFDV